METSDKTERLLARIRAMLDLAEHPNTPPAEAELARERAEKMMTKYRISEEETLARDPKAIEPEFVGISLTSISSEFWGQHCSLWHWISDHFGLKYRSWTNDGQVIAKVCDKCKATKHESNKCSDHRAPKASKAREWAWERRYYSAEARMGAAAGQVAARDVEIDGQPAQRLEERDDTQSAWAELGQ